MNIKFFILNALFAGCVYLGVVYESTIAYVVCFTWSALLAMVLLPSLRYSAEQFKRTILDMKKKYGDTFPGTLVNKNVLLITGLVLSVIMFTIEWYVVSIMYLIVTLTANSIRSKIDEALDGI